MVGLPVRVLIVDDQPEFRELARQVLHSRGYTVVGEAGCSDSAIEAAQRLDPDAVLLDVRLGDDSGFEVAWALGRVCPEAAVLLVSNQDYGHCRDRLRFCGARGFLLKSRLAGVALREYWPDPDDADR
jgi:DNA-binding NarL/FixJ family response regulator